MRKTLLALTLAIVLIISTSGTIFAADNVRLEGSNPDQSINGEGIMILTNKTSNTTINGLCTDKDTIIYTGSTHPATEGTDGVNSANIVKSLIVNNYRPDMTAQQGADLQNAIWFFTNNITIKNQEQQTMIDNALADTTVYTDAWTLLLENNTISVTNSTPVVVTEQIGQIVVSNSVISEIGKTVTIESIITPNGELVEETVVDNYLGNETSVVIEIIEENDKICTVVTTTVTEFYNSISTVVTTNCFINKTITDTTISYLNTTTTTTTTDFQNTTTITETYENCLEYLYFDFNSIQKPNVQQLILFTANVKNETETRNILYVTTDEWTETSEDIVEEEFETVEQEVIINEFNETSQSVTETLYEVQKEEIVKTCEDKPVIPIEPEPIEPVTLRATVQMQNTGMSVIPAILGLLAVLGGIVVGRKG